MHRRELLVGGVAVVALAGCGGAATRAPHAAPRPAPPPRPAPVSGVVERGELESESRFDFRDGAWLSLHHILHELGKKADPSQWRAPGIEEIEATRLDANEAPTWSAAVEAYGVLATKDPVFDGQLAQLHIALAERGSLPDLGNVAMPGDLGRHLTATMPIYRRHWESRHAQASLQWLSGVRPILNRHEDDMTVDLGRWLHASWPTEATRTQLCPYTNWAGAYSTLGPTRLYVGTLDQRNQGASGVEVLFHEAAHALIRPVRDAIGAAADAQNKIVRDLWHVVLFVTAGEVVRRRIPGYQPYGARLGLYDKGRWQQYNAVVARHWQPYLDGSLDFDAAITRMVGALT